MNAGVALALAGARLTDFQTLFVLDLQTVIFSISDLLSLFCEKINKIVFFS